MNKINRNIIVVIGIIIIIISTIYIYLNSQPVRIYNDFEFIDLPENSTVRIDFDDDTAFYDENITYTSYDSRTSGTAYSMRKGTRDTHIYLNGIELTGNGEFTITGEGLIHNEGSPTLKGGVSSQLID